MKNAYVELSFWGSRNVYSINYEGAMYFEDVAQRVTDLINSNPHFNLEDMKFGYAIETKITELFNISLDQEKKAGYITTFFLELRKLFLPSLNFEDTIESCLLFNYCTTNQYREVTGNDPYTSDRNNLFYSPGTGISRAFIGDLTQEEQNLFQFVPRSRI